MANQNFFSKLVYRITKILFGVSEKKINNLGNPKKILIVRQHNQLGDLLASVPLFRALKEKYPESHITLVVSPANKDAIFKNKFIDRVLVFDKKEIFEPIEFWKFYKCIRENYDIALVPVVVSISFTSNLIARLSGAKLKIGPSSLNGKANPAKFLFDIHIDFDWRKYPDSNVYERSLGIVKPFGIYTNNFKSEINYDEEDIRVAKDFLNSYNKNQNEKIIGLHIGAGKPQNRWSCYKFLDLIKKLKENFAPFIYLTGSNSDLEVINFVKEHLQFSLPIFLNKKIPEVAALISFSDLFITNDTGIMHVAGATDTPQISIFGPTNPFNWAPIGINKIFIWKSDLIDDVTVDEVYDLSEKLLNINEKVKKVE